MSFKHMHALLDVFNGTTAERLVLVLLAASCDEDTGVTHPTATIETIARRAGMAKENVRRIVRRFEGPFPCPPKPVPGVYLYPTWDREREYTRRSTPMRWRMPLRPLPGEGWGGRTPRNPTGRNGLQEVTETPQGGYRNPPQFDKQGVTETPPGGYRNPQGEVTETEQGGYRNPQETREKTTRPEPGPDHPPDEGRKSPPAGGQGVQLGDRSKQGASPPHPPAGEAEGIDEPTHPGQATLDDFINDPLDTTPYLITEHQDPTP